ncbi:MAG: hypothetical protein EON48_17220, partial [Acetobacteraceae bacterium]
MESQSRPYDSVVALPRVGVGALVKSLRPTVLICDIEGGELGLFDQIDLSSVRAMVIELHPLVYGRAGLQRTLGTLRAKGLSSTGEATAGAVRILHRGTDLPVAETRESAVLVTDVVAQGPWLLEWIAWHKACGFDRVVAFSRGEDAATTAILDRLDALGLVQHLPHPEVIGAEGDCLAYARHLPALRLARLVGYLAPEEFLNIRTGDNTLAALGDYAFDILSAPVVAHGVNGHDRFAAGWLTETHLRHQKTTPGKPRAMRPVRSLVRRSASVTELGAERPALGAGAIWLDGSARPLATLAGDPGATAIDCRGAGHLVRIERFALRDLESFLADLPTVTTPDARRAFKTFWTENNWQEEDSAGHSVMSEAARRWHATH